MPLLTTSTINSAQGYGLFRGPSGTLTTYTFPSGTSTWTAPSGVTNLVSAAGYGSDGFAGSWSTFNSLGAVVPSTTDCAGTTYGASLDYSVPYGQAQTIQTTAQGWTTDPAGQLVSLTRTFVYYWCPASSVWKTQSISFFGDVRRIGTVSLVGTMPSSGTVPTPPASQQEAFCNNIEFLNSPFDGSATTGFGLTFPGGTIAVPVPSTTTFNNVAVIPGTTYTIVNNGSLIITYYA